MTIDIEILDHGIIGPFMGNVEGATYRASIGINSGIITKNPLIERKIQSIHSIIEG